MEPQDRDEQLAQEARAEEAGRQSREARYPWWGHPPAEGTRRALIRNTIVETLRGGPGEPDLDPDFVNTLADELEAALLEAGKLDLRIIVSGMAVECPAQVGERLGDLIDRSLAKGGFRKGEVGWQLRTRDGSLLDPDSYLDDSAGTLFLDPEVGGGGDRATADVLAAHMPLTEATGQRIADALESIANGAQS